MHEFDTAKVKIHLCTLGLIILADSLQCNNSVSNQMSKINETEIIVPFE